MAKAHEDLIDAILLAYGTRPDMRLWRARTGKARLRNVGALVQFGVTGQADISGILAPNGRRIEVEVKTGGDKQTKEQKRWQRMIEAMGGVYVLARTVGDVAAILGLLPPLATGATSTPSPSPSSAASD